MVLARLDELGIRLSWHKVNGAHCPHAGPKPPATIPNSPARSLYGIVLVVFHRKLGEGDLVTDATR
ncbi:hypothetical protein [Edaphobacter modestus]|uniref:hypothetical protein n=1 Tax=Edaphobacter modestus TaxID=388466 RepID=UPI00102C4922|nr:hypothetical protein [Edaphobacter modestus]